MDLVPNQKLMWFFRNFGFGTVQNRQSKIKYQQ